MSPKTQKRIKSQLDFVLLPQHMETPKGLSLTVPDESMTIQDILRKHVTGLDVRKHFGRTGTYGEDQDFDDLDLEKVKHLDMVEQDNLREMAKTSTQYLQNKLDEQSKTKNKKGEGTEPDTPKKGAKSDTGKSDEGGSEADDAGT